MGHCVIRQTLYWKSFKICMCWSHKLQSIKKFNSGNTLSIFKQSYLFREIKIILKNIFINYKNLIRVFGHDVKVTICITYAIYLSFKVKLIYRLRTFGIFNETLLKKCTQMLIGNLNLNKCFLKILQTSRVYELQKIIKFKPFRQ